MGSVFVRCGLADLFAAPGRLCLFVVCVASSLVHHWLSWWVVVPLLTLAVAFFSLHEQRPPHAPPAWKTSCNGYT